MSSIFVVVHDTPRPNLAATQALYLRLVAADASGPLPTQPESQPHFISRTQFPQVRLRRDLWQNAANDRLQDIVETSVTFIGQQHQPNVTNLLGLRQNAANDQPQDVISTNINFIGRTQFPQLRATVGLRQNAANDVPVIATFFEDNSQFTARFQPTKYQRFGFNTLAADSLIPVETPVHFIGRFVLPRVRLLMGLWQNQDSVASVDQTSQDFVGKFSPPRYNRFRYGHLAADQSGPLAIQPTTNQDFIGRFTPPKVRLLHDLWRSGNPDLRQGSDITFPMTGFGMEVDQGTPTPTLVAVLPGQQLCTFLGVLYAGENPEGSTDNWTEEGQGTQSGWGQTSQGTPPTWTGPTKC